MQKNADMLAKVNTYTAKVKKRIKELQGIYQSAELNGDAQVMIDAPALFNANAQTHTMMSMVVNLMMLDPNSTTTPLVIAPSDSLKYRITPDGKIYILNTGTVPIVYHVRVTAPLER